MVGHEKVSRGFRYLSIVENKCEITGRARAVAQCGNASTNGEARPEAGINKRDDDRVRNGAAA